MVRCYYLARTDRRMNPIRNELNNRQRSEPSLETTFDIEFECQSGNFTDCIDNMTDEEQSIAEECRGVLMFSKKSSSCGAYCENQISSHARSNKVLREGWTLFSR